VRDAENQLGVIGLVCDVTDPASVTQALDTLGRGPGVPRIVVNCAGITSAQKIIGRDGAMPLETFARVVQVNLVGTFNVLRLAAEKMTQLEPLDTTERGVIINTASIAAFEGQVGQASYAASKGGVASLILPAARELSRHGIRVLGIAPGVFETPLLMKLSEKARASLMELMLFPKRLGQPSEYAALAVHMVENTMLNGEIVRLDGSLRLGVQ
jgi:NAD(P)-dependent dehydrogenase (short-subunit alcohol dehydrogenase family)